MSGDLRDDPRATDLLAADPGTVNGLAVTFQTVARKAQSTAEGLRGAAFDACWEGSAAEAFRRGVGKLPGDLDKVTASYQEAADALNAYESELNDVQPKFEGILRQLHGAHSSLFSAQLQQSGAQSALNEATIKAAASGTSVLPGSALQTAVDAQDSKIQNANGDIQSLTSQGLQLLDEFDSARSSAQGKVSSASHVPPHPSFWDSLFHDLGNWMLDGGKFLLNVVKGIGSSVWNTIPALEKFIQDPTLANLGDLAKDVAVDASIVVLLAAAPEMFGVIGAADAAADAAAEGGAEEGASLLSRVGGAVAKAGSPAADVAADASAVKADTDLFQGHFADFFVDSVFAGLPDGDDVADAAGVGDAAAEDAKATAGALQTFKEGVIDRGLAPGQQLAFMTDDGVDIVLHNIDDITDPAQIVAATSNAAAEAASKVHIAAAVGRPVAFAADSLKDKAGDTTSDKLNDVLHPKASTCP